MNYSDLIMEIKKDEGFRAKPYMCPLGFATIGYGTKLPLNKDELASVKNSQNITKEEAATLLYLRLAEMMRTLRESKGKILIQMSENRREVIFNMTYQLGVKGILNFKKMWAALEAGNFAQAADEMKDSKWYHQTPKRAQKLINRMIEG
ncbi:MAG: glycoside hydrolase family protein [Campylobacteraceae bacterium]|jgi:lysozyme|nr:glycoside hydrolase family protein [Campylobacteraceae bacterium]